MTPTAFALDERHPTRNDTRGEGVSILPKGAGCDARDPPAARYLLIWKGEFITFGNHRIGYADKEGQKCGRAHFADTLAIVARSATMVDDLKPAGPLIILRNSTRGPVYCECIGQHLPTEAHLVIP